MLKPEKKSYIKFIKTIVLPAFFCLGFGHLLLKDYMPTPATALIGLFPIFLILFHILINKKKSFAFILIIYFCSHFSYADNQGGLWNHISLGMIVLYFISTPQKIKFNRPDPFLKILIFILFLFNFCGYIVHSEATLDILRGASTFFSYIIMFLFIGNHEITEERFKYFFLTTFAITLYMFFIALNQHYGLININTPLLGGYSAGSEGTITYATTRAKSILGNYELFGEHAAVLITFLTVFALSKTALRQTGINGNLNIIFVVILFFNLLLSGTRSSFLLAIIGPAIILLIILIFKYKIIDTKKNIIIYIFLSIIFVFFIGNYIGLDAILGKFSQTMTNVTSQSSFQDILSGKLINRDYLYKTGIDRLTNKSWLFGYGYGPSARNITAWFGDFFIFSGLHSLYLSLPMIYGWAGATSFILIIVTVAFRLFKVSITLSEKTSWYVAACIGFSLMFSILLINEYKISMLRNLNYHMVVWIWLGFANALFKTIQKKKRYDKI